MEGGQIVLGVVGAILLYMLVSTAWNNRQMRRQSMPMDQAMMMSPMSKDGMCYPAPEMSDEMLPEYGSYATHVGSVSAPYSLRRLGAVNPMEGVEGFNNGTRYYGAMT